MLRKIKGIHLLVVDNRIVIIIIIIIILIYSWCLHSYETNLYQLFTILQKLKVKK